MKRRPCLTNVSGIATIIFLLFFDGTASGYDLTDKFSIGGIIAGAYQYQWVDGDKIYLQSKFAGGQPVKSGKVVVTNPQGVELLSGVTNDEGEFSFKIPGRT